MSLRKRYRRVDPRCFLCIGPRRLLHAFAAFGITALIFTCESNKPHVSSTFAPFMEGKKNVAKMCPNQLELQWCAPLSQGHFAFMVPSTIKSDPGGRSTMFFTIYCGIYDIGVSKIFRQHMRFQNFPHPLGVSPLLLSTTMKTYPICIT
jgi:hypothetical protein